MTADGEDLGALLFRAARVLMDRETPLLREHDLDLWEYAVLSRLRSGAAPAQARLAAAVGRDATRIIPILDRLQDRGLLERTPDPDDRRHRVVTLTAPGRQLVVRCRAAIHAMEDELLAGVPAGHQELLRHLLAGLAAADDAP